MTYEEYMLFKKNVREIEEEIRQEKIKIEEIKEDIKQGKTETEKMIDSIFSSLLCGILDITLEESVEKNKSEESKSETSKSKEESKEHSGCTCNSKCNNCGKKKEPKGENHTESTKVGIHGYSMFGEPKLEDLHSGYLNDEVTEFDDFEDLELEERYEINMSIESNPPKKIDVDYNKIINFQKGLTNGLSSMELVKFINAGLIKNGDTIFCRFENDNKYIDNQLQRYVFDNGTIFEEISGDEISGDEEVGYEEIGCSMFLDGRTPLRWIYISK